MTFWKGVSSIPTQVRRTAEPVGEQGMACWWILEGKPLIFHFVPKAWGWALTVCWMDGSRVRTLDMYTCPCELGSEAERPWGHDAFSGCLAGCRLRSRKRREASCEPQQEASKRETCWRSRVPTSWMPGSHGRLPSPPSCPGCLRMHFPAFSLTPEIQPLHAWCGSHRW